MTTGPAALIIISTSHLWPSSIQLKGDGTTAGSKVVPPHKFESGTLPSASYVYSKKVASLLAISKIVKGIEAFT
jgi:hypothetical protein